MAGQQIRCTGVVGVVLVASGLAAFEVLGAVQRVSREWNFDGDVVGVIAPGFRGEVGRWAVARDGADRVLAQEGLSDDETFNLVFVKGSDYRDLDLSVRIKAVAGELDRGGGVVWRAKDSRNYYIARYNPLESNFRVYKVEDGKRTELGSAETPGDLQWHVLRVTMKGAQIVCYLDGVKHLEVEDATFGAGGMVGLWSKSDARTSFDDLKVSRY